jgi:cysteine desulfurase
VLSFCCGLEEMGFRITRLPVDRDGLLSLAGVENALTPDTAAVSLMWANSETGVLFPVAEIAELCRARGVLFHCDAVQAIGKVAVDVRKVPVDYLAITGHKFGATKGIGALYVRRKAPFTPFIRGGHQELERRGGTESVPLIAGLGAAGALGRKKLASSGSACLADSPDPSHVIAAMKPASAARRASASPSARKTPPPKSAKPSPP